MILSLAVTDVSLITISESGSSLPKQHVPDQGESWGVSGLFADAFCSAALDPTRTSSGQRYAVLDINKNEVQQEDDPLTRYLVNPALRQAQPQGALQRAQANREI